MGCCVQRDVAIIRELGVGGAGKVVLATYNSNGRQQQLAIKTALVSPGFFDHILEVNAAMSAANHISCALLHCFPIIGV